MPVKSNGYHSQHGPRQPGSSPEASPRSGPGSRRPERSRSRARDWASQAGCEQLDVARLRLMLEMERVNRG